MLQQYHGWKMPYLSFIIFWFSMAFLCRNERRQSYEPSVWQDSVQPVWLRSQPIKWTESFSNQSDGSSLGIKKCVTIFPPSSLNLLWREIGEGFMACSELWRRKERLFDPRLYAVNKQLILFLRITRRWSKFYPKVSLRVAKRSTHGEDDCVPQNERRETSVSATEPAYVVGKFHMVYFRF